MQNNDFSQQPIQLAPNLFSLPNPQARRAGNMLKWEAIEGAIHYRIYKNGEFVEKATATEWEITTVTQQFSEYKVNAADRQGHESFSSEPVVFTDDSAIKIFEIEAFAQASKLPYSNYSGSGFVEISTEKNRRIDCRITVETAGEYFIQVHYSNGSGPWNTDNKCAIRSLTVNGEYAGVLVFPQRGKDEWSDWGFGNSRSVLLQKGENIVSLSFEDWNNNMNVEVNTAMLYFFSSVV